MEQVNAKLEPHEAVAKIIVTKDAWTIDNGIMTPTMKVRRAEVEKRYGALAEKAEKNRNQKIVWEE